MAATFDDYVKEYAEKLLAKRLEEQFTEKLPERLKEANTKTASNFLKNGCSVDVVVKSMPELSRDFVEELSRELALTVS